ncbi:MAG: glycine--tRNA ligase subunit beta [SAR324 cluster bacterium]|nr:glycine--tRNA ligase subunit beta [SAR324 cluster bacterium]
MNTYLLEIGLEEMPAQMILPAVQQLADSIQSTCQKNKLSLEKLETYSTPRRLAVLVSGLPDKQEDQNLEIKGPPLTIAKEENGDWSKAAQGFAKKNQVSETELFVQKFKNQDFVFARKEIQGKATSLVFKEHLKDWIIALSFPRNMRWGTYKLKYIRPIRWLLSLWNDQTLPISLEMVQSGNFSYGHRFLNPEPINLPHAQQYLTVLDSVKVNPDFENRKSVIVEQVKSLENQHGFLVTMEKDLLNEVSNLVEWPTVLLGRFDEDFLELPSEVLVMTMAKHQRYFPVYDKNNSLLPFFVTVRNGDSQHADLVIHGNEKVIRARLNDARFFFQEDQKHDLSFFTEKSNQVVFFQKRGSIAQRMARIQSLSLAIANHLRLDKKQIDTVNRIAELCKFDLQSQMVAEFPALQGTMGEHYARLKGENEIVCQGIREHYHPRFAQDTLPQHIECLVVALADKWDMLATAFSLKIRPTGTADPYALRRTAQGIVQILNQSKLELSIQEWTRRAAETLNSQQKLNLDLHEITTALDQFFELRQRFFMQEAGIRYDVIEALMKGKTLLPHQQKTLAGFVRQHLESPAFKLAVEAIVRAVNISKSQSATDLEKIDEKALSLSEEEELWKQVKPLVHSDLDLEQYLPTLINLEPAITAFFDKVMVMDKNPVKRQNRLYICQTLALWSSRYMDLSSLVFSKET